MTDGTKSSVLPIAAGGAVAVAVAIGIVAFLPEPAPTDPSPPSVETAQAAPETDRAVVEEPVPEVVEAVAPPPPMSPEWDTFRVEPDGNMVIAGRADPGQVVAVMLGGQEIARATADAMGAFVALATAAPSEQPRRLSLVADPDGVRLASAADRMIAPIFAPVVVADAPIAAPAAPEAQAAPPVIASAQAEDTSAEAVAQAPDTIVADVAPEPEPAAPEVAVAPTVLQADEDGVRVVQSGTSLPTPNVVLDAITYDPEGEVQLAGRATGEGAVQVYIDNEPLTVSPVEAGGDWRVDLPQIDTGVYTLRIDEVDAEGEVVSRMETPFKREEPSEVAAVMAEETSQDGFDVAVRTVQPGATLWAIAEENLGSGILYVAVFEANSDLIRDPDLIYPGQVFRIPNITE